MHCHLIDGARGRGTNVVDNPVDATILASIVAASPHQENGMLSAVNAFSDGEVPAAIGCETPLGGSRQFASTRGCGRDGRDGNFTAKAMAINLADRR